MLQFVLILLAIRRHIILSYKWKCVFFEYPVTKIPLTYSYMHALQVPSPSTRPVPSLAQEIQLNGKQTQTLLPCCRHLPFLKNIGQLGIWRR